MKKHRYITLFLVTFLLSFAHARNGTTKKSHSYRLMSYNIRNGRGLDDKVNYERIAEIINGASPELVALQELDSMTGRNGGIYTLGELARRTEMHPTYAAAINYDGGKYGVGILSREVPQTVRRIALPGREEARVCLIAEFEEMVFCCTHYSLTTEDQHASLPLILDALKSFDKPVFLAGDMNSEPVSAVQKEISSFFTPLSDPAEPTFPADSATNCIDYIYVRSENGCTVTAKEVIHEERVASDHLPLYVDVKLGE